MSFLDLEDKPPQQAAMEAAELAAVSKQANTILVVSAISILFCCLGGAVATYMAYRAKQEADAGNLAAAQRGVKFATGWMIATYIIGILGIIGKLSDPGLR